MKEAELSKKIQELLRGLGCAVYSTEQGYRKERGGTRTTAGIPDLMVFHPSRMFVFAELKVGKNKPTERQAEFGMLAHECRVLWEVWRSVTDAYAWFRRVKHIMRPGGPAEEVYEIMREAVEEYEDDPFGNPSDYMRVGKAEA